MNYDSIIKIEELNNILSNENVIIIDCRFDLMNPKQGRLDYNTAHIPGAYYAHLDNDLASPITPQSGRHPLPDKNHFAKLLASWGVNHNTQVIVYDNANGSIAARLWWLLYYFGMKNAAVLDGGFNAWINEGFPVNNENVPQKLNNPIPELVFHPEIYVTTAEMVEIQKSEQYLMIDARTPARFDGKAEPIDTVAGHIPGAVNRFHGDNLTQSGKLKTPEELKIEFARIIDGHSINNVVVYCGSGVTSCFHLVAMKRAGIEGALLYAGSWSEWIRDPSRPIAKS
jgi:thiosulfate/3-mercaptopyruvate sulfurtransferase